MTVDEFELRQLARDLIKLYAAMDELKHIPMKPPEVRTMQNTGGKPSMPGNWLWMSRAVEMEQRLRQVAFNAFSDIQVRLRDDDAKVGNLLELIALNAHAISELPWADDFCDELTDQDRTIGKWVNPPDVGKVANEDPYLTMDSLQRTLTKRGHTIPEGTIWYWRNQGLVKAKTRRDNGKTAYSLADVIEQVTKVR